MCVGGRGSYPTEGVHPSVCSSRDANYLKTSNIIFLWKLLSAVVFASSTVGSFTEVVWLKAKVSQNFRCFRDTLCFHFDFSEGAATPFCGWRRLTFEQRWVDDVHNPELLNKTTKQHNIAKHTARPPWRNVAFTRTPVKTTDSRFARSVMIPVDGSSVRSEHSFPFSLVLTRTFNVHPLRPRKSPSPTRLRGENTSTSRDLKSDSALWEHLAAVEKQICC